MPGAEADTVVAVVASTRTRSDRWRGLLMALGLVSGLLHGCGDAGSQPPYAVRDSAGVVVVESSSQLWDDDAVWTVAAEGDVSIGTGAPSLFRITGAVRLEDGSIVVANEGSYEVLRFGATGAHVSSAGGEGEGPGQYRRMNSLRRYRGDSLAVFDSRLLRITILDITGAVGRSISIPTLRGAPIDVRPTGKGGFVLRATARDVLDGPTGLVRIPELLILLAPTGGIRDTLAVVDGNETFVAEFADSRPPFAKRSHFAVHEDRLYFGDAEEVGYRVGSLAGDERRVARIADYGIPPRALDGRVGRGVDTAAAPSK